jgi:hypothetical protein
MSGRRLLTARVDEVNFCWLDLEQSATDPTRHVRYVLARDGVYLSNVPALFLSQSAVGN